jgi:hypothetical protein
MKGKERAVISGVVVFVLALAYYMLILSPKRAEVAELDEEVTSLESSISQQKQVVAFGEHARKEFPRDYGRLVVLGKAVPDQADSASLMVQLNAMAGRANVEFRGISLSEEASGEGTTTPPAPAAPAAPAEGGAAPAGDSAAAGTTGTEGTTAAAPAAAPAPAPATEAGAANLPIGAVVGPAGLPTLPYVLTFKGGFFGIADYMGQVDELVHFAGNGGQLQVNGRLLTVDGFSLKGGRPGSNPDLDANFMLTSYATPSTQGLTAGATPGGPAPTGVPEATPASTVTTP